MKQKTISVTRATFINQVRRMKKITTVVLITLCYALAFFCDDVLRVQLVRPLMDGYSWNIFALLIGSVVLGAVTRLAGVTMLSRFKDEYVRAIGVRALNVILNQGIKFFKNYSAGSLSTKIARYRYAADTIMDQLAEVLLRCIVVFIGLITSIYFIPLTVISLLVAWFCVFTLVSFLYRSDRAAHDMEIGKIESSISGRLVSVINGFLLMRVYNYERKIRDECTEEYRKEHAIRSAQSRLVNRHRLAEDILVRVLYGLTIAYCVYAGSTGLLSPGTITSIILFTMTTRDMAVRFTSGIFVIRRELVRAAAFGEIVWNTEKQGYVNTDFENSATNVTIDPPKGIVFDRVTFAYDKSAGEPALHRFEYTFEAGKIHAIVGPSGGGKSTVLKLLLGLFRPDFGNISVFGVNYDTVPNIRYIRDHMAFVPQDIIFMSGTIEQCLRIASPDATREELVDACVRAGLGRSVSLGRQVGERGENLSGGQKQKLALAMAILRKPKILVMDEPTSGLDPESAVHFKKVLLESIPETTVIVVAHQYGSIGYEGVNVVVVDDGQVAEAGEYEALKGNKNSRLSQLIALS